MNKLQKVYTQFSKSNVYNYDEHVALAEKLDKENKLPAAFMVIALQAGTIQSGTISTE